MYYSLTVTVWFLWGALSEERTGLSFVYAAGPGQVAFLGFESVGTLGHILLSTEYFCHCGFLYNLESYLIENTSLSVLL
jgi:hypothetical protein